jgi:hypothetical protein
MIGLFGRQFGPCSSGDYCPIGILSGVLWQNTLGVWHKNTLQNTLGVLKGIFALSTLGI